MDPAGRVGTVVGWGRTSEGGMLPALAHEVQVPILSLQQCRQTKYRPSRITANMLCAGKGTQDSCQVSVNPGTDLNRENYFDLISEVREVMHRDKNINFRGVQHSVQGS
jgi:hypothetical protein